MKGKKLLAALLTALCVLMFPANSVFAVSYITSTSGASGSNYTTNQALANALNAVFNGDIDVYSNSSCTSEKSMPVGSSMSTSTTYYVKSKTTGNLISGKQCYIYANAVYNKLFREWVGHGSSFSHSVRVISGGSNSASYSMFSSAGVKCGAYMRTTTNSNGTYNGNAGHSLIILSYNSSTISYLEGNANGNGLLRITTETWAEFNKGELSGRSRYISHVVQPNATKYNELYPTHTHSYTTYYESAHPHKIYKKCSCGDTQYTGGYQSVSTCVTCNPLGTSTISATVDRAPLGEYVTFNWTVAPNAVSYNLKYYEDCSGTRKYTQVCSTTDTSGHISFPQAGTYYVYVDSIGVNGDYKCSNYVKVTIYNRVMMSIYYDANGGKCDNHFSTDSTHYLKPDDEAVTLDQKATRDGYTFLGWSTDPKATKATYKYGDAYYGNETVTFYAVWKKIYTTGISVTAKPKKTSYILGDKLSTSGMTVTATYNTGNKAKVTGYKVSADLSKAGTRTVTVTYEGKKATFTVKVSALGKPKIKATTTDKGCTVSWKAISGADKYIVYRRTCTGGKWGGWSKLTTTTATSYTDTTIKNGTKYKYTVRAVNGSVKSSYKSSAAIIRLSTPKVTVSNTDKGITVKWNKVAGATAYNVYRHRCIKGKWKNWEKIDTIATTSYNDTTAKNGAKYAYTVRAVNGSVKSAYKSSAAIKRLATPIVTVSSKNSGISVKWKRITGASTYNVYRRTYSNGKWSGWSKLKVVSSTNYTDKTAKKGKQYAYTVRAISSPSKSTYNASKTIKR